MTGSILRTRWGGIVDPRTRVSGFFSTQSIDGVWWLVDPDGGRFLSKGICNVRFDPDQICGTQTFPYTQACQAKYGTLPTWRAAAARRLLDWRFNSLGAWSDPCIASAGPLPLAIAPVLDLGATFVSSRDHTDAWLQGAFPDVFDPRFETHSREQAAARCAGLRERPDILGWFTDNELRWGPDWRGSEHLLTLFLNSARDRPGRTAAVAWLRRRYATIGDFNDVWHTPAHSWDELSGLSTIEPPFSCPASDVQDPATQYPRNMVVAPQGSAFVADCENFAAELADRYFAVTTAAVRAADPNHLLLGCRFAYVPPAAALAAAGRYVDVIAFNCYEADPTSTIAAYAAVDKPGLISEFSFRGDDSGLPNTLGAGPRVSTQAERAHLFRSYLATALRTPSVVGYHWFEFADQPREGRFDGENSNYGAVTINDDAYSELTRAMTEFNDQAEQIHVCGTLPT